MDLQERPDVQYHTVAVDFLPASVIGTGMRRIAAQLAAGGCCCCLQWVALGAATAGWVPAVLKAALPARQVGLCCWWVLLAGCWLGAA
jgi:hypothetical protein